MEEEESGASSSSSGATIPDMSNFVITTTERTPKIVGDILAKEFNMTDWLNNLSLTEAEKLQALVVKHTASKNLLSDAAIRGYASLIDEIKEADNIL